MIHIYINNQSVHLEKSCSLHDFLMAQKYSDTHFAVAINKTFIPKASYHSYLIQDGDNIETITPMQGG